MGGGKPRPIIARISGAMPLDAAGVLAGFTAPYALTTFVAALFNDAPAARRTSPGELTPSTSKHQHAQENAEDEDDEEDRDRNEKQDLGNCPEARSDSSEPEKSGDH
jgi:hypothetical protein